MGDVDKFRAAHWDEWHGYCEGRGEDDRVGRLELPLELSGVVGFVSNRPGRSILERIVVVRGVVIWTGRGLLFTGLICFMELSAGGQTQIIPRLLARG